MKKILFTLLITLFMIPGVNADCINLFEAKPGFYVFRSGPTYYHYATLDGSTYYYPTVTKNNKYTLFAKYNDVQVEQLVTNTSIQINVDGKLYGLAAAGSSITFTATSDYLMFNYHASTNTLSPQNEWQFWLVEGSEVCTPTVEEPEPDIPPEEPIIPDTTLDSFYSIYLEKLTLLSNFVTENKFALSAIVIILVFVSLELFIYLFKGRRKR